MSVFSNGCDEMSNWPMLRLTNLAAAAVTMAKRRWLQSVQAKSAYTDLAISRTTERQIDSGVQKSAERP